MFQIPFPRLTLVRYHQGSTDKLTKTELYRKMGYTLVIADHGSVLRERYAAMGLRRGEGRMHMVEESSDGDELQTMMTRLSRSS
jgi:hypothetical protein